MPGREFSADREQRTSAYGLLRYAEEYRKAAVTLKEHGDKTKPDSVSVVPYMLIAHSIELGLKAFLRSRGVTLRGLLDVGHDLTELHKEAMRRRLDRLWPEAAVAGEVVPILDEANEFQGLRYIVNGPSRLPQWAFASGVALGLTASLRVHCLRRTFGRTAGLAIAQRRDGGLGGE